MGILARWLRPRDADRALPVPPVGFTDGTVALRPWRPSDGLALADLCDDDEIRRRTGVPEVYPAQEAAGRAAFAEAERRAGRGVYLAVVDARDAVLHGAIDLRIVDAAAGTAEVGYLLGAAHRGRGTMTRALELLAGWAFGPVGLERLELRVDADNAPSLAVAERTGFVRVDRPPVARDSAATDDAATVGAAATVGTAATAGAPATTPDDRVVLVRRRAG